MSITVTPTGAALGAEIGGLDLRTIGDAAFAEVYRAWLDHSVLLIRGQVLTDDDLTAFSRRFRGTGLRSDTGERPPVR